MMIINQLIYNSIFNIDLLLLINAKIDFIKKYILHKYKGIKYEFPLNQPIRCEPKPHMVIGKPISMKQ